MLPNISSPAQQLVARVNDMRADGWSYEDIQQYAHTLGNTALWTVATNLKLRDARQHTLANVVICDPKV